MNCSAPAPGPKPKGKGLSFKVPFAANETLPPASFPLRVLVDTSVLEVYAMDGRAIGTYMYLPPNPNSTGLRLASKQQRGAGVSAVVESVFAMGSAYAP